MKRNLLRSVWIFFIACPVLVGATTAQAQLMVEEGKIFENVQTGQTLAKKLTLYNTGDRSLHVKVSWEDFEYLSPYDGKKKFSAAGTVERSMFQWVKFSPQEFTLAPFSRQVVDATIKVPENARGGYYGVMFFEQQQEGAADFTGVRVITRVGTLFFIESVTKTKKAAVENIRVQEDSVRGQLINQGDTILIPHGIYYFLDQEGVAALRGELSKFYIPVGKTVEFEIPLKTQALGGDRYDMVLTFDLDEGDSVVQELDLVKDGRGWQVERARK